MKHAPNRSDPPESQCHPLQLGICTLYPAICTLQARKKHAELEMASSNVLLFSAPRPIDDFAAVDIALGDARQAGVDRGVGLRVGIKQVCQRSATAIEPTFSGWNLGDAFQLELPASHSQPAHSLLSTDDAVCATCLHCRRSRPQCTFTT